MSNIEVYFDNAQLALAAYSDLPQGMTSDEYQSALIDGKDGMSPTQAASFASRWQVVDQYTHGEEINRR